MKKNFSQEITAYKHVNIIIIPVSKLLIFSSISGSLFRKVYLIKSQVKNTLCFSM